MKLLTFESDEGPHLGVLTADGIIDLTSASGSGDLSSMQALIDGGDDAMKLARELTESAGVKRPLEGTRLLAPLPVPMQIRDCSGFSQHFKNAFASRMKELIAAGQDAATVEREWGQRLESFMKLFETQPIFYKPNRFAVSGPDEDIVWPANSNAMDYELELGCIIGRGGKNITREDAFDHIFGFTIYNDFSARDLQAIEQEANFGPNTSKDFDQSIALGPVIVTPDEIGDPYDLSMKARINGETVCENSSCTMDWRFQDTISYISQGVTLHPGELLGSGTVGWGCGLEHQKLLSDGDVVELEVEKIGILRNRVVRSE